MLCLNITSGVFKFDLRGGIGKCKSTPFFCKQKSLPFNSAFVLFFFPAFSCGSFQDERII